VVVVGGRDSGGGHDSGAKQMKLDRASVLKTLERNTRALEAHGVSKLGLFGSLARDEHSETSDLDFVVEFKTKSFDAYMDVKFLLEGLLGSPVDLVIADAIKPRLRQRILAEAVHVPGL
jgi:hypothetical protein